MVVYNFKAIRVVPGAPELIDIALSRTQRKTPTVVHRRFAISRIREFYMRKIKFAAQEFADRLRTIVTDFPRLDSIHPFYSDLINVLYDRDHYKLALGQLNTARSLIENIGRDYVKLIKFGDSLYRCKQLKRAALGRMCTLLKKHKASLAYLEQVRQHLSRLPSIDPMMRSLLITGYPNCGKSSFINNITRAEVEVQSYAFTTKSLYVGHTDYRYLRWQVIDSPGILDHPLEERNTIEMQAITALAHLQAAILFFIDISGYSDYTIEQQVSLFRNLKALFVGKPVVIVCSKADIRTLNEMSSEERRLIDDIVQESKAGILQVSNFTKEGIMDVRNQACDLLMSMNVDRKMKSGKVNSVMNRIHIAQPTRRDNKVRDAQIPQGLLEKRQGLGGMSVDGDHIDCSERRTIKDIENENGGAGIYSFNDRDHWQLENDDWKYDKIPEFFLGKNVMDFYDPDIEARLAALEEEERRIVESLGGDAGQPDEDEESAMIREFASEVRDKRIVMQKTSRINKSQNKPMMPRAIKTRGRGVEELEKHLEELGRGDHRIRGRSRDWRGKTVTRSTMDVDGGSTATSKVASAIERARQKNRSQSCFRDAKQQKDAVRIKRNKEKILSKMARKGEADRHIPTLKPKHLFSGKRGIGKTDWR